MDISQTPDHERVRVTDSLRHAEQLTQQGARSARWFVRYLYGFAAASFVMAVAFGLLGPDRGTAYVMPVWIVLVVTLAVWAQRQQTRLRGTTKINSWMIVAWTAIWVVLVVVGTHVTVTMLWWVIGGLAMATPPLLAAHRVDRRTRS